MSNPTYFQWLAGSTQSKWNNDSALLEDVQHAEKNGAIGCTTNPPLSYEALTTETEVYGPGLAALSQDLPEDDWAFEAMGLVVKRLAKHFLPLHEQKGGFFGCVRAQVAPNQRDDAQAMLAKGKQIASWGKNVMVKIPVTEAGVWVLEELAALGIPTNPTVTTSVSQMMAANEAFERGVERAKKAGIKPAWSTVAVVMGRIQDYMALLNEERSLGLSTSDLEWAALAVIKRSTEIYAERGYTSVLQPAAFRCVMQVEQISGGDYCSTIHPKIQKMVYDADAEGKIRREILYDAPADKAAVDRVLKALPEFGLAYEPGALKTADFSSFGVTKFTLDGFDVSGWQKLVALKSSYK